MAVSNLDMHALFVLGDLRAKLVKQFQSRFVYITEQTPEGIYIAEIDTETALVVDDKPRLELKVGDHFRAAVLPDRKSVVLGKSVDLGGGSIIKKKKKKIIKKKKKNQKKKNNIRDLKYK